MRLDDGTRVHLADIRMNIGVPVFFGYIQRPGAVHPATALTVTEDLGAHGFPSKARIEIAADPGAEPGGPASRSASTSRRSPSGPSCCVTTTSGRTSRFPRAMVQCRTDDGRTGAGWIEWNQPDAPAPADSV